MTSNFKNADAPDGTLGAVIGMLAVTVWLKIVVVPTGMEVGLCTA
jgi:hypothetical protein